MSLWLVECILCIKLIHICMFILTKTFINNKIELKTRGVSGQWWRADDNEYETWRSTNKIFTFITTDNTINWN